MLSARKGDIIIICGALLWKMAIGFILTNDIANCAQTELVECGLVQTKYLDKFWISDFPAILRTYFIKNWNKSDDKKNLEANVEVSPVAVAVAKFDFNENNAQPSLDLANYPEYEGVEKEKLAKVPFLSLKIDDVILVTELPNSLGWFEGYKAVDSKSTLGICHNDFVLFLYL